MVEAQLAALAASDAAGAFRFASPGNQALFLQEQQTSMDSSGQEQLASPAEGQAAGAGAPAAAGPVELFELMLQASIFAGQGALPVWGGEVVEAGLSASPTPPITLLSHQSEARGLPPTTACSSSAALRCMQGPVYRPLLHQVSASLLRTVQMQPELALVVVGEPGSAKPSRCWRRGGTGGASGLLGRCTG